MFSWMDLIFHLWFFIPGSIPCTLSRKVEEMGRLDELFTVLSELAGCRVDKDAVETEAEMGDN